MTDQQVREIQLGGKQLVFLFMASLVVAVAIFLLGVSVGRGVRTASAEPSGGEAPTDVSISGSPEAPVALPPQTSTTPEDFQYHDQLQGSATPAAVEPPAELPPAVSEPEPKPVPPAPVEGPIVKPAPAPPSGGGWFVQTNAFRSRENADRQAGQLRSKGYTNANVVSGGGLHRVRLGPFPDRADAQRTSDRLRKEEGLRPSVQR